MFRVTQLGLLSRVVVIAGCNAPGGPLANPAAPAASLASKVGSGSTQLQPRGYVARHIRLGSGPLERA